MKVVCRKWCNLVLGCCGVLSIVCSVGFVFCFCIVCSIGVMKKCMFVVMVIGVLGSVIISGLLGKLVVNSGLLGCIVILWNSLWVLSWCNVLGIKL